MDNLKVVVRRTRKFGRGVFADKKIHSGELIAAFDGEIYDNDFERWTDDLLSHTIQIAEDKWRDSKGIARWLNHSCDPNCGIKGYTNVVAMRDIAAGEHITFDYEMTEKSCWWRMKCRCGSPQCRRVIGTYSNLPRSARRKYRGFISHWLTDK
jgi:SET domain-containing protein